MEYKQREISRNITRKVVVELYTDRGVSMSFVFAEKLIKNQKSPMNEARKEGRKKRSLFSHFSPSLQTVYIDIRKTQPV